MSSKVLARLSA